MRTALAAVLAFVAVRCGDARSAPDEPDEPAPVDAPPPFRGQVFIAAAAPWQWQVAYAPRLAPQIGAHAISGLDVVAGRRAALIDPLGDAVPPPKRWPYGVDAPMPAMPTAPADQRIASAWGITTFNLEPSAQGMAMLELRVRYTDAIVAHLNGLEVARSALPRDAASNALAKRPHGPEWETFYIPVGPGLLRLGLNTLALELHPAARTIVPSATVELAGRREKGIVRGPVLAEVSSASARITVDTDPDTDATIVWNGGKLVSPPGAHHTFSLTNLPSEVRYRIHAGATQSAEHVFHTTPPPGTTLRLGIYGDVRGGHSTHRKLVEQMFAEPLDLIAVTGDMVLRGHDIADWQRFFAITEPLLGATPYLAAIGNHDLGWAGTSLFTLPPGPADRPPNAFYYAYDYADLHLVFLDSNAYDVRAQEAWLDADLTAARKRGARAILAFTHDGPYSRGYHRGNVDARTRYVPILTRHHVDFLFSGHDHLYQRGELDGLRYIVTGGGGASLYSPSCGVPGRRACAVSDGMAFIKKAHHFLVVTIGAKTLEVCARQPDGRLLEPCVRYPLWGKR